MEHDQIQNFIFENKQIRGSIVRLSDTLETILSHQDYPQPVAQLLAECLAANTLMTNTIKFNGKLILQIQNQGPISLLVTQSTDQQGICGLAKWDKTITSDSLQQGLNHGQLVMTLLQDNKPEPHQSIVAINSSSIAGALEDYFSQSEQLPTKLWIHHNSKQTVGLLLQLLPDEGETDTQDFYLETAKFSGQDLSSTFNTLDNQELLSKLFQHQDIRLFDSKPVSFHCNCSIDRMKNAIYTLGKEQAYDILQEHHTIEVTCEFCARQYAFTRSDTDDIFTEKS